jgi:hypothetical protein
MNGKLATIAALAVFSASYVAAAPPAVTPPSHLVSLEAAQARLHEAAAERESNLAAVDGFVTSPDGSAALATLGASPDRVRASLTTLSDGELQELAARAAALEADPVAGALTRRQMYIGAAVLAAIILIVIVA